MRLHPLFPLLFAIALLASSFALAADTGCVIQPGKWGMTYTQKYKNQSGASEFNFQISATVNGAVNFDAACDGSTTITGPSGANTEFDIDAKLALPGSTQAASCEILMNLAFTNLRFVAGSQANRPSASANVSATRAAGGKGCSGDGGMLSTVQAMEAAIQPTTRTMTWQISHDEADVDRPQWLSGPAQWQGNGDQNFFKSANDGSASRLDSSEFGVTMVPIGKNPELQPLTADIENVFLAKVPQVTNTYSANVADWGGKPGEVTFTLSGPGGNVAEKTVAADQMSGNLASAQFEIGNLDAGDYTVRAVAKNAIGRKSGSSDLALRINPVPDWAAPFHLQIESIGGQKCGNHKCVIYSGHNVLHWPDTGTSMPDIDVPAFIPFVGGKWGFSPIAFDATIRPRSLVASAEYPQLDDGPVAGSGSLSIAGHAISFKMRTDSAMRTPMAATALNFTQGKVDGKSAAPSVARFEDPEEKKLEGSVDLLTLVPGASGVYKIPVLGGFVQWVMPSIADYSVTLNLGGAAAFGVPDGKAVKLSGGQIRLDPIVANVGFGPNTPAGGFQLQGQFNGMMAMSLNPLAIQDCNFTFRFFLRAGGGTHTTMIPENPVQHVIKQCQQQADADVDWRNDDLHLLTPTDEAAPVRSGLRTYAYRRFATNAPLRVPAQAVALTVPARDGWKAEAVVTEPARGNIPAGRREAILVRNANAFLAAPAVAVATDGHFAVAWIAEDASKPRPVAWQTHMRIFDGKSRSDEIIVGDGVQPNEAPAIVFDGHGHVLVAWSQTKPGPAGYEQTLTPAGYDNNEITVAVVDAATHALRRIALTNDARPDGEPHLVVAADGTVWIAWRSAEPGGRNGFEFRAARWGGTSFGNVDTFSSGGYVAQWQLAAHDAGAAVLVADCIDGATRAVVAFDYAAGKWSDARVLANSLPAQGSSAVAFDAMGKPVFAWSTANGVVLSADGATLVSLPAKARPLALSAGASGLSLILAGVGGLQRADGDAAGSWRSKTLTRSFMSLTTTSVARAPDGNWIALRAEVPSELSRGLPQNADIILNMPVK